MNVPASASVLKLYRIAKGDRLIAGEGIQFSDGAPSIAAVLNRAAVSGRVEIGGENGDHFADLLDDRGDMVETVTLDRKSYAALKNRWMRCRVERSSS